MTCTDRRHTARRGQAGDGPEIPARISGRCGRVSGRIRRRQDVRGGRTDWPQILALYELLRRTSDNPVVALNHAVAVAMVHGAPAGLDRLGKLADDPRIAGDHRLAAARAHLLELAGDLPAARAAYLVAAGRTTSLPQQRYLHAGAARLAGTQTTGGFAED